MVADIFSTIGQAVTGFSTALATSITSITNIFYVPGENGGLQPVGVLVLIVAGVGLVYWAFRLIKGLLHRA